MKKNGPFRIAVMMVVSLTLNTALFAEAAAPPPLYSGLSHLTESQAYQQYRNRPVSELSKIIYLIDRFMNSGIEILYDGHYFSAQFSGRVARWFLATHYRKENAEQWVMRWCNTTVPAGNLIWVKLPDGKFLLAREVLLSELKKLNEMTPPPSS